MTPAFVCPAAETVLSFGSFAGKTLQHILETKPSYLDWLAREAKQDTVREAARATKLAGKDLLAQARTLKKAAAAAQLAALKEANHQERCERIDAFLDALLPVLSVGGVVYADYQCLRLTSFVAPKNEGGRIDLGDGVDYAPSEFYSVTLEGNALHYERSTGTWVEGAQVRVHAACSTKTGWTSRLDIASELPRLLEVRTSSISPSSQYDGFSAQSGDLLDTVTNAVVGTFAHTQSQQGTGFFATDSTSYTDQYRFGDGRGGSAWDSAWGLPPVNFIPVK